VLGLKKKGLAFWSPPAPVLEAKKKKNQVRQVFQYTEENLSFPTVKTACFYHVWLLRYPCLKILYNSVCMYMYFMYYTRMLVCLSICLSIFVCHFTTFGL